MAACEPVDDGAANRAKGWDGELTDNVLPQDRDVFNTIEEDPMDVSADGCEKTENDAHRILENNCASCHGDGAPTQTPATFDFVMDDDRLKSEMWTRAGGTPMRYISVGKADESAIFVRAAVQRDMPPPSLGFEEPVLPRVNFSDISVLRYWIDVCL